MKRDPVCGTYVFPAQAVRLDYHGRTYYFCSRDCKHDFEDRPDEYAKDQPGVLEVHWGYGLLPFVRTEQG